MTYTKITKQIKPMRGQVSKLSDLSASEEGEQRGIISRKLVRRPTISTENYAPKEDFFTKFIKAQDERFSKMKEYKLASATDEDMLFGKPPSSDDLSDGEGLGDEAMYKLDYMANNMMDTFMKRLNISREQAAALVGNAHHETMGFKTLQEIKPKSGKGGYNYFQFTGSRRKEFFSFAKNKGLDPDDLDTGIEFSIFELTKGSEKNKLKLLKNAKTVEEASNIVAKEYLRPAKSTAKYKVRENLSRGYLNNYMEGIN